MNTVLSYLEVLSKVQKSAGIKRGLEAFVLKHGRPWPVISDEKVKPMPAKQCFYNAYTMASANPRRYTYVEGYAVARFLPVLHGWVVDSNGHVIDPTWCVENGIETAGSAEYYGIPIKPSYMFRHILKTGYAGLFDAPPWNFTQITDKEFRPWIARRFYRKYKP